MLSASALDFSGNWDTRTPLMEYAYNNSYQSSLNMTLFEVLYGKKCRTLIYQEEVGERKLLGLKLVQMTTDNIQMI